jgi:hypothetical protein
MNYSPYVKALIAIRDWALLNGFLATYRAAAIAVIEETCP